MTPDVLRQLRADATNQEGLRRGMDMKRRFRLSLRVLMLVIAIGGLGLGWLASKIYCQRKAVALIEGNGGWVVYDWSRYDGRKRDPPGPRWLRRMIGDELFQEIDHICLENHGPRSMHSPSEEVLRWAVRGAPRVRTLWIDRTDMGERAYQAIGKLRRLADLSLVGDAPTDAHLAYLINLTELESLDICYGRHLTDRAMETLSRLPKLEVLKIWNPNLTDRGLDQLSRCKRLRDLDVSGDRSVVSAVGMRHLRAMWSLERLSIDVPNWSFYTSGSRSSEPTPAEAIDKAIAELLEP
jgi:hypothetical protein